MAVRKQKLPQKPASDFHLFLIGQNHLTWGSQMLIAPYVKHQSSKGRQREERIAIKLALSTTPTSVHSTEVFSAVPLLTLLLKKYPHDADCQFHMPQTPQFIFFDFSSAFAISKPCPKSLPFVFLLLNSRPQFH